MEQYFPKFPKKRTTLQGIPKFSKTFSRKFPYHSTFAAEFLEFSVEWFVFRKLTGFQNFNMETFPENSGPFAAVSKFSKVLVEWKASLISRLLLHVGHVFSQQSRTFRPL